MTISPPRLKAGSIEWAYDADAGRYRYPASGRAVPPARVRTIAERYASSVQADMGKVTARLTTDKATLAEWQQEMRALIRAGHVQIYMVGKGGPSRMTQADYGRMGAAIKAEYKYLDRFARDIQAGGLSPAMIALRASMYGSTSMLRDYELGAFHAQKAAGKTEKRRVSRGDDHVCDTCRDEAARGWVDIDEPGWILGHTQCRLGDRCTFSYR